jgi:hypothetical protein
LNWPSFKTLDFRLHHLLSAAVPAALPIIGHAALAFVDVGVGFAGRAADVVAIGFLTIYGFYISASV